MDIFDSAVRTKGDLAGVFEYEESGGPRSATAYFYLHRLEGDPTGSVLGAIYVRSGQWAITEADVAIEWDSGEQRVGLFVFGVLVAAFDAATGVKYGGQYGKDFNAEIPWS
ncbi:hypothetical protein EN828_22805 [Mesorhizobium sp. M2D.F.Ca.ET.185.01.1.1]|uniref:hypothetical protein n=1 Tax=unclassified Mesorhizobium TaxID=325217 RepID=UPI000FCA8EBD|nr:MULTISPECIES: hypothetical protein [unclassified Mesorhizobium]TGP57232.1 hypothetical protein EN873_03835 [bacterium M00.F.Ca.ET.230.01.1.1]TGP77023.1 hypothetical protein EN870_20600 [bacterium M00.F.Ca.ET.227.01.1.1]TGP84850.1 hypothetical protein EN864_28140 [bacterium M00.F.Ca.ET.221.01.1.1]TGP88420.1 hypothetical protein EN865_27440 [bacterium M00.F.Ca.ET.222.01.1.1]TGT68680.1 hypothetical protein EN802_27735 [bacterium M00.F.Ca.ET.159.01.1.1]TGT80514.1 hypothetical protein EN800_270